MYSVYGSSARFVLSFEGGVPSQSLGCGAGYTRYARYASGCAVAREIFFEDAAVIVFFFVHGRVDGKPFRGMCHLFVADGL